MALGQADFLGRTKEALIIKKIIDELVFVKI